MSIAKSTRGHAVRAPRESQRFEARHVFLMHEYWTRAQAVYDAPANIDRVNGMNFPQRETLEIFRVVPRRVEIRSAFPARHMAAVKK